MIYILFLLPRLYFINFFYYISDNNLLLYCMLYCIEGVHLSGCCSTAPSACCGRLLSAHGGPCHTWLGHIDGHSNAFNLQRIRYMDQEIEQTVLSAHNFLRNN